MPDGYELGGWGAPFGGGGSKPLPPTIPGRASLGIWSMSCDGISIDGRAPAPTKLTLVSVHVYKPDADGDEPLLFGANMLDHYVQWIFTDNLRLAHRLERSGFPVRHVQDMNYQRTVSALGMPSTTVDVPWPRSPFGVATVDAPVLDQYITGPHDHNDSFWYGEDPQTASELELHFSKAVDQFCDMGPHCNGVWAQRGTAMAKFLGAPSRNDGLAFDHGKVDGHAFLIER